MTTNQVSYLNILEQQRAHMVSEQETERANRAHEFIQAQTLAETNRANLAKESENALARMETQRSNLAKEEETRRSNQVKEAETFRSNLVNEQERQRSNMQNENIALAKAQAELTNAATRMEEAKIKADTLTWSKDQYFYDLINPQKWLSAIGGGKGISGAADGIASIALLLAGG